MLFAVSKPALMRSVNLLRQVGSDKKSRNL